MLAPSLHLTYVLTDNQNSQQFNFKSISRPHYCELVEYPEKETQFNLSGNPDLKTRAGHQL